MTSFSVVGSTGGAPRPSSDASEDKQWTRDDREHVRTAPRQGERRTKEGKRTSRSMSDNFRMIESHFEGFVVAILESQGNIAT